MENEPRERESLGFLLLAHHSRRNLSHTIPIKIAGRSARLCTRCTGIAIGIVIGVLFVGGLLRIFSSFPLLIAIFPLPGAIDWLVQVFGIRQSTTPRRVVTGILIGNLYVVGGASVIKGSVPLLEYFSLFGAGYFVTFYLLFRKTGALDRYISSAW